jgi:O-antigen ligase
MLKRYLPLIFVLYMSLVGGNWLLYNIALPIRIAHHLILTGLIVYWLLRHGLPNTPMLLPALGMAAAVGLSVVNAVDRRMALENAWGWFTNIGLFLLLIDWFRRGYGSLLFGGAFASGGALTGSALLQGLITPGTRVAGVFGLINLTGGYTAAQVTPAVGWLKMVKSRKTKLTLLGLVAAQLLTLYLNGSRGALLSAGISVGVFLVPAILHKLKLGIVTLPLLLGVGLAIAGWSADPQHSTGDVLRLDLWRAAAEMVDQHPASGVGVGLFGQVYRDLRTIVEHSDGMSGAHNLYLNLAAELGGFGLAAGAAMLLTTAYLLMKVHWDFTRFAMLGALVGVLAHMLVDNFPVQNYSFLVALYVAFLIHDQRMSIPGLRTVSRAAAGTALIYCLVLIHFDRAQIYYERSRGGDLTAAMEAVELDPSLKLYRLNVIWLERGLSGVSQADPTINGETNRNLYALVNYGRQWL